MYKSQCWFDKYLLVKEITLDAYDGLFSIGPLGVYRNDT